MYFWYKRTTQPEKFQLRKKVESVKLNSTLYHLKSFLRILVIISALLLQIELNSYSQTKTEQILFAIFDLHKEQTDNNFKKIQYQSYSVHEIDSELSKRKPISFSQAKNNVLKQNACYEFDDNGLPIKITVCDNRGNTWTQEPHFDKKGCKNIYCLKNNKLHAIYKVCMAPNGECFLTNLMGKKYLNSGIKEYHDFYHSTTDGVNFLTQKYSINPFFEEPVYAFSFRKNKSKPLKNVEYKLNDHGDWVKLIWFNRKHEPLVVTERKITYHQ